jgi:hypothetical protein
MPPERAPALQREGRIQPEDLDVARRSLAIVRDATIRPIVKQRLRGLGRQERLHALLRTSGRRGLAIAAEELIDLHNAEASPAELELYPLFLSEIISDLQERGGQLDRAALEEAEIAADTAEDALQGPALVRGFETPVEKLARARALRLEAATAHALARRLEQEVRQERLGLSRTARMS